MAAWTRWLQAHRTIDFGEQLADSRVAGDGDDDSICLIFLKLFDRVYAPLTAGVLSPVTSDSRLDRKRDPNSTASTSASSTMSTPSFTRRPQSRMTSRQTRTKSTSRPQ
jgi:hypothetical protein